MWDRFRPLLLGSLSRRRARTPADRGPVRLSLRRDHQGTSLTGSNRSPSAGHRLGFPFAGNVSAMSSGQCVAGGPDRARVRSRCRAAFREYLHGDRRETRRIRLAASRGEFPRDRSRWLVAACQLHPHGLARTASRLTALRAARSRPQGPRVVPALIFGVGGGLIGSGLFVTDPVAGFPPSPRGHDEPGRTPSVAPTPEGRLHNLCAIPIFAGIPFAALTCATFSAHRREYRWASYSAGSAIAMTSAFVLFGAAFGGTPRLAERGGVFQRISVATGFGWLSALSLRTLIAVLPSRTT